MQNSWTGKGKHWDREDHTIGVGLKRVNENVWFNLQRGFLLWLASSDYGRDLLHIPKGYGKIDRIAKNHVSFEVQPGVRVTDFRVGAKWGNVTRFAWDDIKDAYRAYERERFGLARWRPSMYPIAPSHQYAYTTSTFYPDPHTETTSVDGWVWNDRAATDWADLRNDTNGTTASDSASGSGTDYTHIFVRGAGALHLTRGILLFDTSAIGDTDTIDSATLSVKIRTKAGTTGWDMVPVACAPASNTALAIGDFSAGITLDSPTEFATRVADSSLTNGNYHDFTLNASGLAAISKTGVSKFMNRSGSHDIDNSDPGGGGGSNRGTSIYQAEEAGTTSDPKLVVVHTAAASAAIKDIISMGLLFPR